MGVSCTYLARRFFVDLLQLRRRLRHAQRRPKHDFAQFMRTLRLETTSDDPVPCTALPQSISCAETALVGRCPKRRFLRLLGHSQSVSSAQSSLLRSVCCTSTRVAFAEWAWSSVVAHRRTRLVHYDDFMVLPLQLRGDGVISSGEVTRANFSFPLFESDPMIAFCDFGGATR